MPVTQPSVAGAIISFALHAARAPSELQGSCLTAQDRMQVGFWQVRAREAGFDRMVIHDRDEGDATEVGNFLSVYRRGQAWSSWGFARAGSRLRAWCCLTGTDVGEFTSMDAALATVLKIEAAEKPQAAAAVSNLITLQFNKRVGSAA